MNEAATRVLGLDLDSLNERIDAFCADLVTEDGRSVTTTDLPLSLALSARVPSGPVVVCRRSSGTGGPWFEVSAQPVTGATGDLLGAAVAFTDVTVRMLAQRELRSVFENMGDGVVVQASDGAIIDCNPAAERILGLSADQLAGRSSLDQRWHAKREDGSPFPGEEHPAMVALRTGTPQRDVVMAVHRPDGTDALISVSAEPMPSGRALPSAVVATFTDSSTDSDGTIASRSWNFGDGTTSTATNPSKTYSAAGTYSVSLTVTDNAGATNTKTSSVTVSSSGCGGTVLCNGVAVTGLGASTGNSLNYTMVVPAGATGLKFTIAGGTGDADLYVKFGSAPTDTVYDCRPYASGNSETCNIATAQAGTYFVRLKAYSTFSGVSLTGSYTTGGGGQTYTNGTDVNIPDNNTTGVTSSIVVSGRTGNGQASTPVAVSIVHTYIGDLIVDLIAPDGSVYNLHNRTGAGTDNINQTYTVNLSSEAMNGTWLLRVSDRAAVDTGRIDSWSITF